jgi:hypothetical protein
MLQLDYMQIVLGGVILFIIACSLCTSVRVVPYSRDNLFAIEFPYEGFDAIHPENCQCGCKNEPFSGCRDKKERKDGGYKTENKDCLKVHGFNDLYCPPSHAPIYFDKFLGTTGGGPGNSYGLSNSQGGLQLSQEQIQLLTTRGGNSTGTVRDVVS